MQYTFEQIPCEQRQHLNLSDCAHDVMESDTDMFQPGMTASGFINHIIRKFWDISDASIEQASIRWQNRLESDAKRAIYKECRPRDTALKRFDEHADSLNPTEKALLVRLAQEHRSKLIEKSASYPKGPALKIRLQNEIYRDLYDETSELHAELKNYGGNPGRYIKAIMESYARLPLIERESIFFRETFEQLRSEASRQPKERRLAQIRMKPTQNSPSLIFHVKIHDLTTDVGGNYHYLVGMSRPAGDKNAAMQPASIRLSRIEKVKFLSQGYGSGKITEMERKQLTDAIAERGVPYLLGETSHQVVELTSRGFATYGRILHMRPAPASIEKHDDGSCTLTFQCTNAQISNYFKLFGPDAVIVEPGELAESMREYYTAAAAAYGTATAGE